MKNQLVKRFIQLSLNILCISVFIFIQACATTSTSSENPWQTPNRSYSVSSQEEVDELEAFMQPCIDYAQNNVLSAYSEYMEETPPNSSFSVVAHNDQERHFYTTVTNATNDTITGRINSNELVHGLKYSAGDKLLLRVSHIIDWLVTYTDRPEEGNLLGKYLLMRQEGLMSGPCNPKHSEFQHFRLFRKNYSFVPPIGNGWLIRGKDTDFDVSMATKSAKEPNEVNTLYATRYRAPLFTTDQELIEMITDSEKKNVGEPGRVTLKDHKVTAYKEKKTRCVLSHQVIDDKQALLSKSGERGLMTREIRSLACVLPSEQDTVVILSYSHRYHPGHRDPEFNNKANTVFNSLAFKIQN